MDKLFEIISQLLNKDKRIEVYSSLNQHLVDNPNVVLWDKSAASISDTVYRKFKESINKKSCHFYTINKILPYYDLCIALLCSVGYTLNHNTISKVQARTFKSAWRSMSILTGIGDKEVQDWIKDRIKDRDAIKYCTQLGLSEQESPTISRKMSLNIRPTKFTADEDIISKACSSRNIKEITHEHSEDLVSIVSKVTTTPEAQLDNLRIIHKELIDRSF